VNDNNFENGGDEDPHITPAKRHQFDQLQKRINERINNDPKFAKEYFEKLAALNNEAIEIINSSTSKPFRGRLRSRMRRKLLRLLGIVK